MNIIINNKMERSKKIKYIKNTNIDKKTRKKCFVRLSPTNITTHENTKDSQIEGNWYSLDDLYFLINNQKINPETGVEFREDEIEKIKCLYENYDTNYIDFNDIATKTRDIDPIYHNIDDLENMIEEQNMKIEENYSQILNLMEEIQNLKQKHLRM
jgi:hypothetical protein